MKHGHATGHKRQGASDWYKAIEEENIRQGVKVGTC
jgi:hypothetical protein